MIQILSQRYNKINYITDTAEEMNSLPKENLKMGCTCYVVQEYIRYILGGDKKWYPYKNGANSSPADELNIATPEETEEMLQEVLGG